VVRCQLLIALSCFSLFAVSSSAADGDEHSWGRIWYDKGSRYATPNDWFAAHFRIRGQFRYSDLDLDADSSPADPRREESEFSLNRGRFKLGGHIGPKWMEYYTEYDFTDSRLLDLWVEPKPYAELSFRIGQYKVPYNRERFDSSGKQQFVERSVVTPSFTLDRQIGITMLGRLFAKSGFDSSYWVGVFRGTGRGGDRDDDGTPMVFGRWQWNINKEVLPFTRSDLKRHPKPTTNVAVAATSNRSPFTRFSSEGGGQLLGFKGIENGDFSVDQAMGEVAFMYRGFSIQSELHYKQIEDNVAAKSTDLAGFYFDAGYFLSESFRWAPRPLEVIGRFARVRPDDLNVTTDTTEYAVGANWFFDGHNNKLTFDITQLKEAFQSLSGNSWGVRLQWDVSI